MKIVKLVSRNKSGKYKILINSVTAGSITVSEDEIKKMTYEKGMDEKYILEKVLRILEKKASQSRMIKYFIYSDTEHTSYYEKLGFIKRKRFFDYNGNKYFKMFKII